MEQSKEAQAWSERSLKVLETLAEAVGHDPFNIPPLIREGIGNFEKYVSGINVESPSFVFILRYIPPDSCLRFAMLWNLPWSKVGYHTLSDQTAVEMDLTTLINV